MCSLKINLLPATQAKRIRVGQLPNSVDVVKVFHTKSIDALSSFLKEVPFTTKTQLNEVFANWIECHLEKQKVNRHDLLLEKTDSGLVKSLLAEAKHIAKQIKQHSSYLGSSDIEPIWASF